MLVELSYADVQMFTHFIQYQKKVILLQQEIRGVIKYGEAVRFMVLDTRFPEF